MQTILKNLEKDNILLIVGARQVGKSTLLKEVARQLHTRNLSVYKMTLEDPELLSLLNDHPENIFRYVPKRKNRTYILLDEIQYLRDPSNFLKYIYDLYHETIKLIVTGSSAFYIDRKFKDSLAGRKKIVELFPFCFSEFLEARSEPHLSQLIRNQPAINEKRDLLKPEYQKLQQYSYEYCTFGGYPRVVLEEDPEERKEYLQELVTSFLKKDIHEAGIQHEDKFFKLIRILASQTAQQVNANELGHTLELSKDTVSNYLYILQKSYIISLCPPFYRSLRKELTKMPRVFFFDNGYRNSLLRNFDRMDLRMDIGQTLENMLFSELTKRNTRNIKYWRTQDRHEVDFVIDEKWAYEVKANRRHFKKSKYARFCESYPDIPLRMVTSFDDAELDLLDFSG